MTETADFRGQFATARTAMRLQRDLGINLTGIAVALDLLGEVETLRARLSRFNTEDDT